MRPNVNDPGRLMAHRGASMVKPENTLAAFQTAFDQGATWIEFDVSLLGDGTAVVHHDGTLDRCTNGTGPLSDLAISDLDRILVGGTEPLPTLDATLDLLERLRLFANLEIKCHAVPPGLVAEAIAEVLRRRPWAASRIVVSSFQHDALTVLRRQLPEMPLALLYVDPATGWQRTAEDIGAAAVHVHYEHLSQSLLRDARQVGVDVRVYTINDPPLLVPFIELGLGGVITDHPPLFLNDPDWAGWIAGR